MSLGKRLLSRAQRARWPVAAAVAIELDPRNASLRPVDEAPLGTAGAAVVEGGRRNRVRRLAGPVIGTGRVVIPLVRPAGAVAVLLAAHQHVLLLELGAIEPPLAFRGCLDALQQAGGD